MPCISDQTQFPRLTWAYIKDTWKTKFVTNTRPMLVVRVLPCKFAKTSKRLSKTNQFVNAVLVPIKMPCISGQAKCLTAQAAF
jgi:hypothetical protein